MQDPNLAPLTLPNKEAAKAPQNRLKSILLFVVIMAVSLVIGYGIGSLLDSDLNLSGGQLALLAVGGILGFFCGDFAS